MCFLDSVWLYRVLTMGWADVYDGRTGWDGYQGRGLMTGPCKCRAFFGVTLLPVVDSNDFHDSACVLTVLPCFATVTQSSSHQQQLFTPLPKHNLTTNTSTPPLSIRHPPLLRLLVKFLHHTQDSGSQPHRPHRPRTPNPPAKNSPHSTWPSVSTTGYTYPPIHPSAHLAIYKSSEH